MLRFGKAKEPERVDSWRKAIGKAATKKFSSLYGQQIKFDLREYHPQVLELFYVGAKDRVYQFWERNLLSVELHNQEVGYQKLEFVHENPVKAGLCSISDEYNIHQQVCM